jgi:hypothetical protein
MLPPPGSVTQFSGNVNHVNHGLVVVVVKVVVVVIIINDSNHLNKPQGL